ncbi:MAG: phosphate acyltransferase PlsX [Clostridia bacterium]|nr:phosphate acyltransferase PlsX [Clostridia bacterium]
MTHIIVDAMGGDNAPKAVVDGCIKAVEDFGIKITLVGNEELVKACLGEYNGDKINIVNANDVITNDDDPAIAIRRKKESSIVVAMKLLADGVGDAFVSAGSTGAVVSGATLIVKRIDGVRRVAIGSVFPTPDKPTLVLDCGANSDCTSEFLQQFAIMGNAYMQAVYGIDNPTVALLNNGAEEHKGSTMYKETHQLLKNMDINFIGNIEGRDIFSSFADVVVADGFAGNIMLKTTEGTAAFFSGKLKEMFTSSLLTKICALILKKGIKKMKASFDYTEHGGAPILGAKKVVIKAHGSSNSKAFYNAIRQAKHFYENGVIESINNNLQKPLDE